jgi:hypothetical protein
MMFLSDWLDYAATTADDGCSGFQKGAGEILSLAIRQVQSEALRPRGESA